MSQKKVRIVIDSTADTRPEVKEKCTVVPLSVRFGEQEFVDGVTINYDAFYQKLIECDTLPTTSQPSPQAFSRVYEDAVSAGEQVVVLTIASNLSGTYQSACIAAMDYSEDVFVVDSKTAAIAGGILAEYAVSLMESGMDAASIAAHLTELRDHVCIVAMLDTLEYLKMGGRISKTAAFAAGMLNIKPVITLKDGQIEVLGKARGSKQGNNFLVKQIEQVGGVDFDKPVLLGYSGLNDDLLQKYITDSTALWEGHVEALSISPIGSVIGTHVGPGAVAVAFFKKSC